MTFAAGIGIVLLFFGALEVLVAIALLLGERLHALQGAAVYTGIPFTLVILAMCYCPRSA